MVRPTIFPSFLVAVFCGALAVQGQAAHVAAVATLLAATVPGKVRALRFVPSPSVRETSVNRVETWGDPANFTFGCRAVLGREELFWILPCGAELVYSPMPSGLCPPSVYNFGREDWTNIFARDLFSAASIALLGEPTTCRLVAGHTEIKLSCTRRKYSMDVVVSGSRSSTAFPDDVQFSFPMRNAGPCGCKDMRTSIVRAWRALSRRPEAFETYLLGLDLKEELRFVLRDHPSLPPRYTLGFEDTNVTMLYRAARDFRVAFDHGPEAAIGNSDNVTNQRERHFLGMFVGHIRRAMEDVSRLNSFMARMNFLAFTLISRILSISGSAILVGEFVDDTTSDAMTLDSLGLDPELPPPAAPAAL